MILNPYSPSTVEGETASQLWFERSLFDGQHLASVSYGVHLSVFAVTLYHYLTFPKANRTKIQWFFVLYIIFLFSAGTLNAAGGIRFDEMAWIDDRDFPGGPAAYNVEMYSAAPEVLGNCGYVVADLLADGLLLWRVFMLYGRSYSISLVPALAYLASMALGFLSIYQAARPSASIWSHSATEIAIPYFCLSLATNALLSVMIAARLLWHRRQLRKTLGPEHTTAYTSIAAMFIESSALYAVIGIAFVVCFARGSNVQNLLLGILGQVECIGPELILLKVIRGRSWNSRSFYTNTNTPSADMRFKKNGTSDTFIDSSRISELIGKREESSYSGNVEMDVVHRVDLGDPTKELSRNNSSTINEESQSF